MSDDAPLVGNRFRVTHSLKSGQGIETVAAFDLQERGEAVLKLTDIASISSGARQRLEHEALVLQQLESPGLCRLLAMGEDGTRFYLATQRVDGQVLQRRLRQGQLPLADVLVVARWVLRGLMTAHESGVLHRDVKPGNIIVDQIDPRQPLSQATLIDFGLARSARLVSFLRDVPVGTVRYMSPEQAGLIDHPVEECSDLYGLGMVLYECLLGRPAFGGESLNEVLRQHLTERPSDLRAQGLQVPRVVDGLLQRLLAKDPRDVTVHPPSFLSVGNHTDGGLDADRRS